MPLYPSLEDYKVDSLAKAELDQHAQQQQQKQQLPAGSKQATGITGSLYPSLGDYMGLSLSEWAPASQMVAKDTQIAPISQHSVGLKRAEIRQGLRPVILCKGADGKLGLRIKAISNGLFVAMVYKDSPAALAGLRFGDQLVEVNGESAAGWNSNQAAKAFKRCPTNGIQLMIRDRPFERTITVQKDSQGYVGFVVKNGAITALVKNSSAARNGLLTDHHVIEVNGENCVGLADNDMAKLFANSGPSVTLTIMPSFVHNHMIKCLGQGVIRKWTDRSAPNDEF